MIRKRLILVLKYTALVSFSFGTLYLLSVLLAGGSVIDYWAAIWKEDTDVRRLTEQAFILYIISLASLVLREIIDKDES